MKIFHYIAQKILIFSFVLSFVFVSVYTPQPYNEIKKAEAVYALETTQWLNQLQLLFVNTATAATAISTELTATKELFLDGIAWALAKQVVAAMTRSIVQWINSGFQGKPAFVQDLGGFLTQVADDTFGLYLEELGGDFSFLCSPFKLDIQISLATVYARERDGYLTGRCTLTGALENIENFVGGDFASGGWDAWFDITAKPEIYTPYGSQLTAKQSLDIKIANARGEERTLLEFGSGFLSSKECESPGNCKIVTPGQTISDALTFQLSTGPRSLIAADEIDEIIGALLSQLAQQAITGAGGLLGLGGGSGSGGSGGSSYLDRLGQESANVSSLRDQIVDSIEREERYLQEARNYRPRLQSFANNFLYPADRRDAARNAVRDIDRLIPEIEDNIVDLVRLLGQVNGNLSASEAARISREYLSLRLHSNAEIDGAIRAWQALLATPPTEPPRGG